MRRVAVLATGGTIAGTGDAPRQSARYSAATVPIESLLAAMPTLADVAQIVPEQVAQVDSKNVTPALWAHLRERVQRSLDDPCIDGVVVTHGTDTLEETAFWLHLTTSSDKPVVLTGAMRPSTALSADGPANLHDAVAVAACPSSRGRGVVAVLAGRVHAARDVTKASTDAVTAFESGESGVLGRVSDGRIAWNRFPKASLHGVASTLPSYDTLPKVDVVMAYVGASRDLVDALVATGVRGIVVAGYGSGALGAAVLSGLVAASRSGVAVVFATRVRGGFVSRHAVEQDDAAGFISAGGLSACKARILATLGLAMGEVGASRLQALFYQAEGSSR